MKEERLHKYVGRSRQKEVGLPKCEKGMTVCIYELSLSRAIDFSIFFPLRHVYDYVVLYVILINCRYEFYFIF